MLEQLKSLLRDQLGLSPSVAIVLGGLVAHIALNALLRKPPTSAWGLFAPLILGIAVESYEIWDQYAGVGLFAHGNDPILVILARHALDVAKALSGPLALIALGRLASD